VGDENDLAGSLVGQAVLDPADLVSHDALQNHVCGYHV
jgi:hypothetical protein